MGVTIHYRGKLNNTSLLPQLLSELTDIASVMKWKCQELDDDWAVEPNARLKAGRIVGHLGLKGVQMIPHKDSEALAFFFDRGGVLHSPAEMALSCEGHSFGAWVSVKTQFAPPDVHIRIVGLLKYIKKTYISDLEVADEGGYWETGNRDTLIQNMETINAAMNRLEHTLSSGKLGDLAGLSGDQIASRIEKYFREE